LYIVVRSKEVKPKVLNVFSLDISGLIRKLEMTARTIIWQYWMCEMPQVVSGRYANIMVEYFQLYKIKARNGRNLPDLKEVARLNKIV